MRGESYNEITVGLLTQTAGGTVNLTLVNLSRANDNLATALSVKESARFCAGDNSNCRDAVLSHHLIRNFYALSASVNCESASVSILNHLHVVIIQNVMGESESFLATISTDQTINHERIDVSQNMRKVSSYIVAP